MNQILVTEKIEDKNKKEKIKMPMDINKNVKFFAIAIIVFGLLLVGSGIYSISKNKKSSDIISQTNTIPAVNITQEGSKVLIVIKHDKPIDKIKYSWNDGEITTLQGMGRTKINESIIMPLGENTLKIRVIDNIGKEGKYERTFSLKEGQDLIAPTIELEDDGEGNVKIVAKDDIGINYIEYSWNDGEATKVEAHPDSPKQIQEKIKSLEGFNELKIVAVDTNNNKNEKEQKIYAGSPKVSVTQEQTKLVIKIKDDVEVKKVEYVLNGKGYSSDNINLKEFQFEQELDKGINIFTMLVTNKFNKQTKFEGKCTR